MMSLRAIARSAPRAVCRVPTGAVMGSRVASRNTTSTLFQAQRTCLRPQQPSAFSTSVLRRAPAGETDHEVSSKLASEIEFEQEVKQDEPLPSSVKDFLENGPFAIQDTPGKEEVLLTRTFGNEKITVSFSIADLQNYDPDVYNEDSALTDEDVEDEGRNGGRQATSDGAEDGAEDDAGVDDAPVPVRLNVVIEKSGKGALNIEASAQDGNIVVENVYYFDDAKLAHGDSAEVAHTANNVYPGPPFGSLDEDLQILLERYLEERGISQALALFVPDYMEVKEQKEYSTWLSNVKKFVDA